ncbi:MAG: DUF2970 domain-containing protein [Salinisphaeraceae bacterium]|nr:DUF2970 domain-containing protein [Salinisphaeraceae bacterium]
MAESTKDSENGVTLWQTVKSVAASFFGVQSSANRERDFSKGKPQYFIIVGLLMTLVFVGGVILAVQLVMKNAGL